MQVASNVRKVSRVLNPTFLLQSQKVVLSNVENPQTQWRHLTTLPGKLLPFSLLDMFRSPNASHSLMARGSYSSEATEEETAKEVYDKMLKSVEGEPVPNNEKKKKGQTMPPNKMLWSLVEKCNTRDDIALLFQMLQNLRRFRLSNLRIHDNFNCTLCTKVAEACARVGAIDYGKKVLWEHNKYGLTPSVSSAHHLLLFAKKNNDSKLMVEIMKLLKRNHLPLQPGTADIVFSICSNTNDWELISKYANKFIKAGVKLRRTTFGTWMEFAARRGDVESILKIENLRSSAMEKHNLATAFSCAKGFLLQGKPENAAGIIHVLNEKLPDGKKNGVATELQKLVSEWPLEVIKNQKEEDRKELATSLERDIPAMINILVNIGLKVEVNLDDLKEAIPS